MEEHSDHKQIILFTQLIFSLQAAAMQQLGKIADPMTGSIVRELGQAKFTIDTLDMLRDKCRGNLSNDEERFLDHILSDLKLNYIDEASRPEPKAEPDAETVGSDSSGAEPSA
jgi:hypothetical protein